MNLESLGLTFLWLLLVGTSLFMILLILVQRGRGGGLSGALGGAGGQSAFGSKAGDVFTKITVVTAVIWIMLSMLTITLFNKPPLRETGERPLIDASGTMSGDNTEGTTDGSDGATGGNDDILLPGESDPAGEANVPPLTPPPTAGEENATGGETTGGETTSGEESGGQSAGGSAAGAGNSETTGGGL